MCPSSLRVLLSFLSSLTNFFFGHTPFLFLSPQLFSFSVVCPFGCWEIDNEEKSAVTKGRSTLLGGKSVNIPASPYVWNKDWDGEQRVGILQFAW